MLQLKSTTKKTWTAWFSAHEPKLFLLFSSLHLLIIWLPAWFFTYDGPAHLHNAQLLLELFTNKASALHDWYDINSQSHSNWLYYLLASPLLALLPPAIVEKAIMSLYVVVFAYGFRHYLRLVKPTSYQSWSYLVFYFVFHYNFLLGQYNFALGVAMLWWALIYGQKVALSATMRSWAMLTVWLWLIFLAHMVVFLLAGLFIGLMILHADSAIRTKMKQYATLALLSLPPLLLSLQFIFSNQQADLNQWLPFGKLIQNLLQFQIIENYHPAKEHWFTAAFVMMLLAGLLHLPFQNKQIHHHKAIFWMLLSTLLLYFTLPDATAGASFVSTRLATIAGLLMLVLASNDIWPKLKVPLFTVVLFTMCWRLGYYIEKQVKLGNELAVFDEASALIAPNSLVHQLNYSPNWLHQHITMAVFAKGITHLHNYEPGNNYFPLRWRKEKAGILKAWRFLGDWPPCVDDAYLSQLDLNSGPDYYLRWFFQGPQNACDSTLNQWLTNHFKLVHVSANSRLEIWQKPTP